MIARTWHGAVPVERGYAYQQYLLETGAQDYQRTPGNRGVYVLRRNEDNIAHFRLMTLWDSLDAIKAFAGDNAERARYYPEDEKYLLELEPIAMHYEVLAQRIGCRRDRAQAPHCADCRGAPGAATGWRGYVELLLWR